MHKNFFSNIYEISRTGAARELCVDFAAAKNTVHHRPTPRKPENGRFSTSVGRRGFSKTQRPVGWITRRGWNTTQSAAAVHNDVAAAD
jgi:hypothetical protein